MRSIKTVAIAATAAAVLGLSAVSPASAQRGFGGGGFHSGGFHGGGFHTAFRGGGWRGGGWHGGGWRHRGWGPAVVGGLAVGALAAAPYYDDYGCGPGVAGYDVYGQPIVTNDCY
jgi:hypothetical protein